MNFAKEMNFTSLLFIDKADSAKPAAVEELGQSVLLSLDGRRVH